MDLQVVDLTSITERELFDLKVLDCPACFIQQTTLWADIVAPIAGDEPKFCYQRNDRWFIGASMYLYRNEAGNILVSNVQAGSLGTIVYQGKVSDRMTAYDGFLKALRDYAKSLDCVAMTLTTNPFEVDDDPIRAGLEPQTGMDTFIMVIPVKRFFGHDGEAITDDKSRNFRRNLKKGLSEDFRFEVVRDKMIVRHWYDTLHVKRIRELEGEPLPWEIFENAIRSERFANYWKFFAVYDGDEMVSGDFCIHNEQGLMDNFMMSSSLGAMDRRLNYFLVHETLKWCRDNDIRIYNWQSSNPPSGGIFQFKQGWGSHLLPYKYMTRILDEKAFKKMRNDYSLDDLLKIYKGHFLAPWHAVKTGELGFWDKDTINREAGIYQTGNGEDA